MKNTSAEARFEFNIRRYEELLIRNLTRLSKSDKFKVQKKLNSKSDTLVNFYFKPWHVEKLSIENLTH